MNLHFLHFLHPILIICILRSHKPYGTCTRACT